MPRARAQIRTCLWEASRTLRILPLRGKTPYLSLPITPSPDTASDLAESPSVSISVHSRECLPPGGRGHTFQSSPVRPRQCGAERLMIAVTTERCKSILHHAQGNLKIKCILWNSSPPRKLVICGTYGNFSEVKPYSELRTLCSICGKLKQSLTE